jgi:hypothetical protein
VNIVSRFRLSEIRMFPRDMGQYDHDDIIVSSAAGDVGAFAWTCLIIELLPKQGVVLVDQSLPRSVLGGGRKASELGDDLLRLAQIRRASVTTCEVCLKARLQLRR